MKKLACVVLLGFLAGCGEAPKPPETAPVETKPAKVFPPDHPPDWEKKFAPEHGKGK